MRPEHTDIEAGVPDPMPPIKYPEPEPEKKPVRWPRFPKCKKPKAK